MDHARMIMKVYSEWRISSDSQWLKELYPKVKASMDYCINTWDPRHKGILEEPHHNTYDIEFWGSDGMCTSFYLGALLSVTQMGEFLKEDVSNYQKLLQSGKTFMRDSFYNGEYFYQKIHWQGLKASNPVEMSKNMWNSNYSEEAQVLLKKEGPKYLLERRKEGKEGGEGEMGRLGDGNWGDGEKVNQFCSYKIFKQTL